jgi:tRNA nucleotidyltransferase (CCA-adding enzyme)
LRLPSLFARAGAFAARYHMIAGRYAELRPGTRVDFLVQLQKAGVIDSFLDLVAADRKEDHGGQIRKELAAVLAVHLPATMRDQGPASGERLRELRCRALGKPENLDSDDCEATR